MRKDTKTVTDAKSIDSGLDKPVDTRTKRKGMKGGRIDKRGPHEFRNHAFNPSAWYEKYPELFSNASRLGFNHIAGTTLVGGYDGIPLKVGLAASKKDIISANVMKMEYITTPGHVTDNASGFALQIRQLYLAMKNKFRGLNTYEPSDLGVTLFCVAEFYRYIAKLERIYGICKYYHPTNRIMPISLPAALGIDYADISNNLSDFRLGINTLIVSAATLCLPEGLDIINRWFLLESNVFKDSENLRANYLLFDSPYFYSYQATVANTGGAAVLTSIKDGAQNPNALTAKELLTAGRDLLDLLITDSDITLQCGDVISYFTKPDGSTNLLRLQPIPEDYVVIPVYNEDILQQVHNATFCTKNIAALQTLYDGITFDMTQFNQGTNLSLRTAAAAGWVALGQNNSVNKFSLSCGPFEDTATGEKYYKFSRTADIAQYLMKPGKVVLDTWKDSPSESDVMEMTRLTTIWEDKEFIVGSAYYHKMVAVAHGTEVMTFFAIYSSDPATVEAMSTMVPTNIIPTYYSYASKLSKFDWHPIQYLMLSYDNNDNVGNGYELCNWPFGDLDNYRIIDAETAGRIHDAAVMSLFKIDSVAAFSNSFSKI